MKVSRGARRDTEKNLCELCASVRKFYGSLWLCEAMAVS